jgi:hypothetical protein
VREGGDYENPDPRLRLLAAAHAHQQLRHAGQALDRSLEIEESAKSSKRLAPAIAVFQERAYSA